jgi:hypothetical protein
MIRDPKSEDDMAFVYSTWANNINDGRLPYRALVNKYLYVKASRRAMEKALSMGAKIKFACDDQSPDTLHGYVVYQEPKHEKDSIVYGLRFGERTVLHFLFVKSPFRGLGLGRGLLTAAGVDPNTCAFTCWTDQTAHLWAKYKGAIYAPLALFDQ